MDKIEETKTQDQVTGVKQTAKSEDFVPRRLKVVVGGPRGDFLIDADTGEDLRLPVQTLRVHWASTKSHADASFLVDQHVQWREWKAEQKKDGE